MPIDAKLMKSGHVTLANLMESDFPEGSLLLIHEYNTGKSRPEEVTIVRYSPSKERIKLRWDTQDSDAPGLWLFKGEADRYEVVEVLREGPFTGVVVNVVPRT